MTMASGAHGFLFPPGLAERETADLYKSSRVKGNLLSEGRPLLTWPTLNAVLCTLASHAVERVFVPGQVPRFLVDLAGDPKEVLGLEIHADFFRLILEDAVRADVPAPVL